MSSTTSVALSNLTVSLEAENATEHALVLSSDQGTLRVVGTIAGLRSVAQNALTMPIPPLRAATSHAAAAPADDARLSAIEATLARLTDIAERAQRRGLI